METAVMILLVMFAIGLGGATYFCVYRNDKVYKFRDKILKLCSAYNIRCIEKGRRYIDAYVWFYGRYTYYRMVFSFKPLKLEAWYTEKEIERINS